MVKTNQWFRYMVAHGFMRLIPLAVATDAQERDEQQIHQLTSRAHNQSRLVVLLEKGYHFNNEKFHTFLMDIVTKRKHK